MAICSYNFGLHKEKTMDFQITGKDESQANRFYSAFYRKLLDQQIGTTNKRAIFLNLLYRVLQRDQSVLRLYAFIKRILQITLYFPANMACATLYVVSKILRARQDLRHMFFEIHKPIKIEHDICEIDDVEDADINIIMEETKIKEENPIMLTNVTIGEETALETKPKIKNEIDVKPDVENVKSYDPFCRNPLYAGATKGCNTELISLSKHFHPSVALFANSIIQGKI